MVCTAVPISSKGIHQNVLFLCLAPKFNVTHRVRTKIRWCTNGSNHQSRHATLKQRGSGFIADTWTIPTHSGEILTWRSVAVWQGKAFVVQKTATTKPTMWWWRGGENVRKETVAGLKKEWQSKLGHALVWRVFPLNPTWSEELHMFFSHSLCFSLLFMSVSSGWIYTSRFKWPGSDFRAYYFFFYFQASQIGSVTQTCQCGINPSELCDVRSALSIYVETK